MSKKNKILLIFPKAQAESNPIPMNLLLVAGPLLKKSFDVTIIDQRIQKDWEETLNRELKGGEILAVGLTVLTGRQIDYALEISKIVRENSQAKIVWGGVHPSLLPRTTLQNEMVDIVVIGEGEETMAEFCECIAKNGDLSLIKGIAYKTDGEIRINPARDFINLAGRPIPPYQLVDVEKYVYSSSYASGRPAREIVFYTSRGCPHRCGFCYNQIFNKSRWRGQAANEVVEHLEYLIKNFNINAFNIEDDEFFVDPFRVLEICRLIKEKNLKIEIFSNHRINYLDKTSVEDLKKIKDAGFLAIAVGIESGSPRILELINKDITREQVLRVVKKLKNADLDSKYCFMVGFPGETIEDIYQTTDLMQQMKQINPGVRIPPWRIFTPYPGTDLYEISQKNGFVPPSKLEDWAKFEYDNVNMPWVNKRTERIIKNVVFLIRYLELPSLPDQGLYLKLSRLYSKTVNYRWKKHWFGFVPEKYIIENFLKFKNLINNL